MDCFEEATSHLAAYRRSGDIERALKSNALLKKTDAFSKLHVKLITNVDVLRSLSYLHSTLSGERSYIIFDDMLSCIASLLRSFFHPSMARRFVRRYELLQVCNRLTRSSFFDSALEFGHCMISSGLALDYVHLFQLMAHGYLKTCRRKEERGAYRNRPEKRFHDDRRPDPSGGRGLHYIAVEARKDTEHLRNDAQHRCEERCRDFALKERRSVRSEAVWHISRAQQSQVAQKRKLKQRFRRSPAFKDGFKQMVRKYYKLEESHDTLDRYTKDGTSEAERHFRSEYGLKLDGTLVCAGISRKRGMSHSMRMLGFKERPGFKK